jgi:tyrosine-protein kinase Etk/Wzc
MSQTTNTEDTIDLKELFFSLIAQWKLIALCILLSLICALLYLRTTPDTYSVDALVQVEENKGASAALLGDLSSMVEQKQPAQAEIEILKSRLVLGRLDSW